MMRQGRWLLLRQYEVLIDELEWIKWGNAPEQFWIERLLVQ